MGLTGKVAVVTGASRGIGRATALALARGGADVVVTARTLSEPGPLPGTLTDAVADIEAIGGRALAVPCNVGKQDDLDALVEQTVAHFGHVDVLVNNAAFTGGAAGKSARELTRKEWDLMFAVNIAAPHWLTMGFLPHFPAGGGVVINVTSVAAQLQPLSAGNPSGLGNPAYGATKAALNRLGNFMAAELQGEGIAVITLDPGLVFSATIAAATDPADGMPSDHVTTEVPARAIASLAGCDEPMLFTGDTIVAAELLRRLGRGE
ncbi:MAG TPA: SDR family NAD(P)-dependent oxidoreductase [Acidimicrobiia bacterium]|jgi:NAD(P)-dependent dehydrogenase (short-subunit alcohol dehydrogenase family)